MATCRAEAGLRVPLSIPSWLSSNIAELRRTRRCERLRRKGVTEPGAPCTCHMRSDVHPGPWPSPERREQHGTPLHCEACPLVRIHSPWGRERRRGHAAEEKCLTHTRVCVYIGSPEWKFSSQLLTNGVRMMLVLESKKIYPYILVAQNRNKSSQSAERFCCVSSLACLHGWQGRHKVKQHQTKKHQ